MKKRLTSPESEDPAVLGEQPADDAADGVEPDVQTSRKAGTRSMAQKQAGSRYPDRSMPASHQPAGAFGKEPEDTLPERDEVPPAKKR
jgi:hypothetical protein